MVLGRDKFSTNSIRSKFLNSQFFMKCKLFSFFFPNFKLLWQFHRSDQSDQCSAVSDVERTVVIGCIECQTICFFYGKREQTFPGLCWNTPLLVHWRHEAKSDNRTVAAKPLYYLEVLKFLTISTLRACFGPFHLWFLASSLLEC